jgi:hydroxymethylbilane synthase
VAQELRIGTRGSPLALWQAHAVASRIAEAGGPPTRIVTIKTTGDRVQDAPTSKIGGKRLFVKEIEDALLNGDVELAVHSSKDMSAVLPDGLVIAGVLPREDPLDAVVLSSDVRQTVGPMQSLDQLVDLLGGGPTMGTGSVRRVSQLKQVFPFARFEQIRGNVETRLRKLDEGEYDALVLAAAGLRRLGLGDRISLRIPARACVPAPGQGIVAIETRADAGHVRDLIGSMSDSPTEAALDAERAVVEALGGGCQTPIGALAIIVAGGELEVQAVVVSLDGRRSISRIAHGAPSDAAEIGRRVGQQLLADGAGDILEEARRLSDAAEGTQP